MFLSLLLITRVYSTNFPTIFNYKGHSYYISGDAEESPKVECICQTSGYYSVDINNEEENIVIKSMIKNDTKIGIYKTTAGVFRSFHDNEKISYIHNNLSSSSSENQVIISPTGQWSLVDRKSKGYYICESDKTSPTHKTVDLFNFPTDTFTFDGKKYDVFTHPGDKQSAKKLCTDRNSELYAPKTERENCVVNGHLNFDIVLNVDPTQQRNYTNWERGYPLKNKKCAYTNYDTGKWSNSDCKKSNFVCVSPAKQMAPNQKDETCRDKMKDEPGVLTKNHNNGGHNYKVYNNTHTYYGNKQFCKTRGMKFYYSGGANVTDPIQTGKNFDVFTDYRITWHGNMWNWTDKIPTMIFKWNTSQPKNPGYDTIECTCIQPDGLWTVRSCYTRLPTVCIEEKKKIQQHSNQKTLVAGLSALFGLLGLLLLFGLLAKRSSRNTKGKVKYKTTLSL